MKFGGMVRIGPGHIARARRDNRIRPGEKVLLTFNHRRRLRSGAGGDAPKREVEGTHLLISPNIPTTALSINSSMWVCNGV